MTTSLRHQPRAVAVDLDGTLVDTARANVSAYRAALRQHGVFLSADAVAPLAGGRHWSDVLPGLLAGASVDPAEVAATKRRLYADHLGEVRVNESLRHLLTLLAAAQVPLALVTTASRQSSSAVLSACGLSDLFTVVVTGDDVVQHKPHPEAYETAARLLCVDPSRLVAVEDSQVGAASARAAGAQVWTVEWNEAHGTVGLAG